MARYFIDRPIFAWVLAILVMLFGLLAIRSLPVAQFPALAPPQISIAAVYPGADATTLDKTTTQIIEQQLQGIDNLRYFSSQSASSGNVTITLTFDQGTDPDTAQVQVQNKVQAALSAASAGGSAPGREGREILRQLRAGPRPLFGRQFAQPGRPGGHDGVARSRNPISRINGVGNFQLFGSQYAMRIWVDPMKLNSYQLTMADVTSAVQAQNAQVSAGQLGNLPAPVDAGAQRHGVGAVAAADPRTVRRDPAQDNRRRLGRPPSRRRAGRARRRDLRLQRELQRPSRDRGGHPPRARRQRTEDDRRRQSEDRRDRQAIPGGRQGHLSVGHDAVRQGFPAAGHRDLVRGDAARLPRHVPVPAEHPRDPDPDHRHPGRAARHAGGDERGRVSASTR